ncbi:Hypothetical predicted protein [Mytilus galloprovincialis]|uniref:Uncharacterized protein n=1 Tax=Mytilus galloprovincialis TaxID=29158 RepID=A0A8B6EFM1_MYTGA|nr:Hypothetical predicted protein [Mytilus galloprovincialis]
MVKIIPAYPLAFPGASASAPPVRQNYQNDSVKKACSEAGLYDIHPYHDHERFPIFEEYTSYHTDLKNKTESQVKDEVGRIKIALWWINQNAGKAVPTLDLSLLTCKAIEDPVCLKHGHRPGVIVNMKVTELQASQHETVNGEVWRVVRVAEHKTSEKHTAQIENFRYVYEIKKIKSIY